MAKKKTFEEYTQEALYEIEKTEAALKQAKLEKEQAEHRIQRSLNYLDTQKKKKRKARTHLLIQKGAVIEAICKDTKYLTEAEFYQLMDELLHDPACKFCDVVHEMFSSSPYSSFTPFSTLPFSLLRDRHFCRKGNPSSDGSSANTFGIPLQKDATSVGRTYLLRYISALFCFQHPSLS